MLSELPLLSFVIWFPILGGVAVLFVGDENPGRAKVLALTVAICAFLASLPLQSVRSFNRSHAVPGISALDSSAQR